jgi:creatinine amidohydrolase
MTAERRLDHMTSPEIAAAISQGARTVVLPCGAIEQHGPHLPLSMDSDHADRLAVMLADRLPGTLVAPTLRIGCSSHHLAFPGTLSLRPETLEALIADCCASLARHGFERVLVFSAHIGNFPVLTDIAPRLQAAAPDGVEIVVFTEREAVLGAWRDAAEAVAGLGDHVGGHADIAESSIMLVVRPDSVRHALAEPGYIGSPDKQTLERVFSEGVGAIAPTGVLGNPRGMSAEIGAACLEAVTAVLIDAFSAPTGR